MNRAIALALGVSLISLGLAASSAAAPAKAVVAADPNVRQPNWRPPKNAWGQPDLSGMWTNVTLTPLTRDLRITDKLTLSPAEAHAKERFFTEALAARDAEADPNTLPGNADDKAKDAKLISARADFASAGGDVGGYNTFWLDPGTHMLDINGQFRTSILTTPNGQIPPRKSGGAGGGPGGFRDVYDSYENRPLGERCISFARNAPPPMLPNGYYNNNYQIVQTGDSVAIQVEHIHDVRIVRLNDHHRTDGIRSWLGRLGGPLRGKHPCGGDHERAPGEQLHGLVEEPEGDGTLHPHLAHPDQLPVPGGRPGHLGQALGRRIQLLALEGHRLRIRLP